MGKFIKKYKKDILFFFLIIILLFITIIFQTTLNYDEIWRYQIAKAISNGYIPYKDINMIVTPLYYFLMSSLFIFKSSLLLFRIEMIVFWFFTIFLMYKIFKTNKKNIFIIYLYLTFSFICFGAVLYLFDYNTLIIAFCLLLTYLRLKIKEKDFKYFFFIGIILAFCDLTKQSIGLFIVIINLIFYFIENRKNIKKFAFLLLGLFIPNFVFLIYLLLNNSFFSFFDYCLFGLKNFNNVTLLPFIVIVFTILTIVIFILAVIKFIRTKNKDILYSLVMFLTLLLVAYPLLEIYHLFPACLYSLVLFSFLGKEKENNTLSVSIIVLGCSCMFFNMLFIDYNKDFYQKSQIKDFEGFYTLEVFENYLIKPFEYGKEKYKDVLFISEANAYISIYNNTYNGIYDLFLEGNLGTKTLEELFDNDSIVIIDKKYLQNNTHNLKDLPFYLKENYELIDTFICENKTYLYFKRK